MNTYPQGPIRRTISTQLSNGLPVRITYSLYEGDAPDVEEIEVITLGQVFDIFDSLNDAEIEHLSEQAQQEEFDRAADALQELHDLEHDR